MSSLEILEKFIRQNFAEDHIKCSIADPSGINIEGFMLLSEVESNFEDTTDTSIYVPAPSEEIKKLCLKGAVITCDILSLSQQIESADYCTAQPLDNITHHFHLTLKKS